MLSKLKYLLRSGLLPDRLFLLSKTQHEKKLYLTFDDGPVPGVIEQLLDLLDIHQIKATFFVIGSRAEQNPRLITETPSLTIHLAIQSFIKSRMQRKYYK